MPLSSLPTNHANSRVTPQKSRPFPRHCPSRNDQPGNQTVPAGISSALPVQKNPSLLGTAHASSAFDNCPPRSPPPSPSAGLQSRSFVRCPNSQKQRCRRQNLRRTRSPGTATKQANRSPPKQLSVVAQPLPLGALVVEALHVLRQRDAGLVRNLAEFSQLE